MKQLTPYKVGPKQQTAAPPPAATADAQAPSLPGDTNPSAPKMFPEPTPRAPRPHQEFTKWGDDLPYTRYWGINE
jgi:hypothetical protein